MKIPNTFSARELLTKFSGSLVAGLLLLSVVTACRSSSSSDNASCTGEVTYEGKTFTGKGKNAERAQRSACINYCLNADPEVEPSKKEAIKSCLTTRIRPAPISALQA